MERLARNGSILSLGVSAALAVRVIAIDNPEALVILAPAITGGVLGLALPRSRPALLAAAALTVATAIVSLIGYVGFLYVPSIALLGAAGLGRDHERA